MPPSPQCEQGFEFLSKSVSLAIVIAYITKNGVVPILSFAYWHKRLFHMKTKLPMLLSQVFTAAKKLPMGLDMMSLMLSLLS